MSDDDIEMIQVSHLVPEDVKEDAKNNSGHGDLSDAVRQAYEIIAYGDDYEDTFRLQQRLERARNEYQRLTEDKEQIEREMREVKSRMDTLEDKLEAAKKADSAFEDKLQELQSALRSGEHIFESHGEVQAAAEIGNTESEQVIDLLRERNPDIPDDAFVPHSDAEFAWDGVESDD